MTSLYLMAHAPETPMRRRTPAILAILALLALCLGSCGGGGGGDAGDRSTFGTLVWGSDRWQRAP